MEPLAFQAQPSFLVPDAKGRTTGWSTKSVIVSSVHYVVFHRSPDELSQVCEGSMTPVITFCSKSCLIGARRCKLSNNCLFHKKKVVGNELLVVGWVSCPQGMRHVERGEIATAKTRINLKMMGEGCLTQEEMSVKSF